MVKVELNDNEYRRELGKPRSEFLAWFMDLSGYDFYLGDSQIDRWQLRASGYRSSDRLLSGETIFSLKDKPPYDPHEYK